MSETPASDPGAVPHWPGGEYGVSERESEVLVLLGEGMTNAEIATALFVSLETVKSHVSTTIGKLGVRNRVQAATYVVRTSDRHSAPPSGAGDEAE